MKIAVLSLADINNYGDVFFPYLLKNELLERIPDAQIDIVTNTHYDCGLFKSIPYEYEAVCKYDAIVMGGGELISPFDDEAFRKTYGASYSGTPSDVAFGWLDVKDAYKAWFSIGAHPILWDYEKLVDKALSSLDFCSVRGTISKKVLERDMRSNNTSLRVMPDLGWLFTKYIDQYSDYRKEVADLGNEDQEYFVFQGIDDIDLVDNIDEIIRVLKNFQKDKNIRAVVLPIMKTKAQWGENLINEKIKNCGEIFLLPEDLSILEVGTVLKNAKFFVGSSLHGAVTAMAYGHPAVNIRSAINTKLQDIHSVRCRSTCFANGWDVLEGVLPRLYNESHNEEDHYYANSYAEYQRYRIRKEIDALARGILSHCSK